MLQGSHPFVAKRSSTVLSQHADEHRPERPVLLAVDQQFGHGSEDDAASSG